MDWLELVLGGALCLLTVPVSVLLLQVLAALRARKVGDMEPAQQPPYLAVVGPGAQRGSRYCRNPHWAEGGNSARRSHPGRSG